MSQDTSAQVIEASSPHKEPLYITLLASEWNSLAGGLSTLNRELAIQLAQQTNVKVSLLVPEGACNDRDKREAQRFYVNVVEAKQRPGCEPLDWLGIPPEGHRMDVVIGHGVKLGRQVHFIKRDQQFPNCKWVHTVHTAAEHLGKYKDYKNPASRAEQKHWEEVGLCKCADLVVAVGPKLEKAYFSYLEGCKKRGYIFGLTPGLFDREFGDIVQIPKTENDDFKVLLCGRGDNEDFELKGYDIAVEAFADPRLKGKSYELLFVGAPDGMQDEVRKRLLNHGITNDQLTVRKFVQCRSDIKDLLCEVDLAIMPSKSEGFGLVALEALSAGLPVLAGSNSGFASAIRDLTSGAFSIVDSWTSTSQALAADDSMEQETVVIPEGTSRGTQSKQPATKPTRQDSLFTSKHSEFAIRSETCVEPTQSGISYAVSSQGQSVKKQERRSLHLHSRALPPVKKQRRDTGIRGAMVQCLSNLCCSKNTAQDQAVAAVNLGEQGACSVSESVSYPDATTIQHIVGDAVSSGRENGKKSRKPGISEAIILNDVSPEGRSVLKQGRRPLHLHPRALPPVKEQRRDTDIRRVFTHNSVVVKLLRAEYKRRAQLRPLFWDSTIQLPLEKVYTRLKIVSRQKGANQRETKRWCDVIWAEDSQRDEIWAEARANKVNPCDVFGMLKENKDVMTIVEGNPGIGKTTFCLQIAYEWANQSSSAASFPEFELVLLLKCRDIDGDLTEAITEQLFPKDLSKDAREELLRFLQDIENQERVLIILDGLDELAEKSKHYVVDLLHRKRWACCYVLATTRQEKGIEIRKQPEFVFNLFLQIEGFTEKDSFEYIRKHFKIAGPEHSSKGEKLIAEIKKNVLLQELQTNPLHLLLLCVLYEDHEGELPSSRTDLFHDIVVCLLRRYCAKHNMKASKNDSELETQFERDIRCLGKLAWNCLLKDRHSCFEEELEKLESRNRKLVVRRLGFVYKEESLKRLKPQHEYSFLQKSFQEYLAASYVERKLRRKKLNVFKHLSFHAMVNEFSQVFVFVCGILREKASILFARIGEELKSDWDWLKCSKAAANFFIESWSESGNAERMANTLCLFMPFPPVVHASYHDFFQLEAWNLVRVLFFCRRFSKLKTPDEIYLKVPSFCIRPFYSIEDRDFASLPNLKSLDFSSCVVSVKLANELFQVLPDFASLTELALPDLPDVTDWGIVAEALTTSETLETVGYILLGERGEGWARALDAGLCADTPLSSVNLTICGGMSETALQALEKLLLNKSLFSVSVIVEGDMPDSLARILARCLAGQTVIKSLELRVKGKLSFCGANLIQGGIVKNTSLSRLEVSIYGELPDNWQGIANNLKTQLTEELMVTFEIDPNTFNPVTATQLIVVGPCVIKYGFFEQRSVTLNVWGELTVDGAEAIYSVLPCTWVCHLTLNIHGKLTDDFLHCTARHVDKQRALCPITINTWDQLSNEGKALFKELELDKNPAVTLNVCEVHVPSDESSDDKIVSIDNPLSLITLLEEAKKNGKESLTVTVDVQSDDSTYIGRCWNDSLLLGLPRNCTLSSLTLTINNFSPRSTGLSPTLIGCLESCILLKSLNLTLNEYNELENTYASRLHNGLGRNTSLISLTLTLNINTRALSGSYFDFFISDDDLVPNISINSFTLTISDFTGRAVMWVLSSGVLWSNYQSLNTFNLTINNWDESADNILCWFWNAMMKVNSLRTLRLKINDWRFTNGDYPKYDFSELVEKSPSLELIELTICHYGVVGSWLETLKWVKQ
ncbi:uncharacterized protein [Acropora muricata]|uniref:uncharacterized protein isoform X5 n=1 Tax=Acropora muricata TaxID=159855 RepID=UPI0034E5BC0C